MKRREKHKKGRGGSEKIGRERKKKGIGRGAEV